MCTRFGLFVGLAALAAAGHVALAQQVDRSERMEAALGKPAGGDPDAREASARLVPGLQPDRTVLLPNQWSIKPAGEHIELGDTPTDIAMHPTEPSAAIVHCGQGEHEVIVVDPNTRRVACRAPVLQSFNGVTFDRAGKWLFASGGKHDVIHSWAFGSGLLSEPKSTRVVP